MGSCKIVKIILILFIGGIITMALNAIDKPDIGYFFKNKTQMEKWSEIFFPGGYRISNYENNEKRVLIIIGSFTSGIETSYLRVYIETAKGFELILIRESVQGEINIISDEQNITFKNKVKSILILPWEGVLSWSLIPNK